jgi:hypothetical protein
MDPLRNQSCEINTGMRLLPTYPLGTLLPLTSLMDLCDRIHTHALVDLAKCLENWFESAREPHHRSQSVFSESLHSICGTVNNIDSWNNMFAQFTLMMLGSAYTHYI